MKTTAPLSLLSLLFLAGWVGDPRRRSGGDEIPPPFDWGVAYYMSYDNNLEAYGRPIIAMIRDGVKTERTVAAVQADFRDPDGMHRYTVTNQGVKEIRVYSDDSASEDRFLDYVEWFARTFRCRHYVVIVLDHGGDVDQMCFDGAPETLGRSWMSGRVLGQKLRKSLPFQGRWPLLFLQQCGRGTLENLYSFRGTADYVMASPWNVGAPNTYYTAVHEWLGKTPDASGAEIAARIATEDEHYRSYTCVVAAKLGELPARLQAAIRPFLDQRRLAKPTSLPVIYRPAGTVDAEAYFTDLAAINRVGTDEVTSLVEWLSNQLVFKVWTRHSRGLRVGQHSGLGLVPSGVAKGGAEPELLGESRLGDLWQLVGVKPTEN
jgi:hypothetical protein